LVIRLQQAAVDSEERALVTSTESAYVIEGATLQRAAEDSTERVPFHRLRRYLVGEILHRCSPFSVLRPLGAC
jgi:hypothetical protein